MGNSKSSKNQLKLLNKIEVLELIGVSYPCLFYWIREGKFPAGRAVGSGRKGHIAWVEQEVLDWIESRPRRYPKGTRPEVMKSA